MALDRTLERDNCSYAERPGERRSPQTSGTHPIVSMMERHSHGTCLRVLDVQIGPKRAQEWEKAKKKCLAALHTNVSLLRTRGNAAQKLCRLHLAVFPTLTCCSATRDWTRREMKARTMQLRLCRRAFQLWPRVDQDLPSFFRRTARGCDRDTHPEMGLRVALGMVALRRPSRTPHIARHDDAALDTP